MRAISQGSYQRLFDYSWPGNVRELQNTLERAILLCKGETIEIETLLNGQATARAMTVAASGSSERSVSVARPESGPLPVVPVNHDELSFEEMGKIIMDKVPDPKSGGEPVDVFAEVERAIVSAALKRTKGNKQAAANLLGLYRPRLYSMIKKHNL